MSSYRSMTDASGDVSEEPFRRFGNATATHLPQLIRSTLTRGFVERIDPEVHNRVQSSVNYINVCEHYESDNTEWEEAAIYVQEGEDNDKFAWHPKGKLSKMAYKILHHPIFQVFDLVLSVLLMLLALIENPAVIGTEPDEHRGVTVHSVCEIVILSLLGVDIVLRFIWLSRKHFIKHRWTMFITLILCLMFLEALTVLIRHKNHMRITRSLRPVFFIDTYLMGGVRRVLRQIFKCLKQIVDVILLLLFIVALFSLFAYFLFAEDDPLYFKTFGLSFVSLFITTTTANNPDVMMEAYRREQAVPLFFVIYLVLTLYFVNNILLAMVYSNFAQEEKKKFRQLFLHKIEALNRAYSVLATPNGIEFEDFLRFMQYYKPQTPEWQVMCVFKALHKNCHEDRTPLRKEEFYSFYEVQNLKWREVTDKGKDKLWFQNFTPSIRKVFHKIHALVKWQWFNSIIYLVILANTIFLVVYSGFITESEVENRLKRLHVVLPISLLFLLVYIIENILKMLALGPFGYFQKFWNICDVLILLLCLIALCLELNPHYQFLVAVRPLKLIRLLRLKKRYRDIMNTLVVLTYPRLISIFLLLLIIYYFFAILGMEFFQGKVREGCCRNASYNVGEYYTGSLNETTIDVYYLNSFDNLLRSYSTLFILMVVNNWYIIMEAFVSEVKLDWMARIYFIAFYIVTVVVLQVVIAFIVDAFVLQLQQNNLKKNLEQNNAVDDADCIEDEDRKKVIRIALQREDIHKLKYEIAYRSSNETYKEWFGFNHFVRYLRRIKLPEDGAMQCSGRRLRTKDDLQLLTYRADIEQWIQEQEEESLSSGRTLYGTQQQEETLMSPPPERPPPKIWTNAKKALIYLLE